MTVSRGWVMNQWMSILRYQVQSPNNGGDEFIGPWNTRLYTNYISLSAQVMQMCRFRILWDHVAKMIVLQKLHMIKWKRDNGISIADTVEILIPLSCSKTSICKHYYQASHPYKDVEKEYRSYDRPLSNTVGMGQDIQLLMQWRYSCT